MKPSFMAFLAASAIKLGVKGISKLRIGKSIVIELEASDQEEAKKRLEFLCDRLLSNPVIENWSLELKSIESISET